ncbi:MAG: SRPBCC family protein [Bdellovibrionaceae bacterium]|nr:SRPBCC family protein [Pseudobdellovibrionaceae bacterium]
MAGKRSKPNEIYITRIYDAPVSVVWDAWTDPAKVALWWGPRGFTLTTHSKDLRVGGSWAYTMHGPDGVDYENKTIYHEVEKHSRLVYDHGGNDDRPPLFRVTVEFSEIKGKTKMEMTMALATPEAAVQTKAFIKKAGGDSTWDRLAEYLGKTSSGKEKFVINRSFAVPLETMFDMWTDPKHVAQWLPPTGFRMEYLKADIRPGGGSFYCMMNDTGIKMYGRAQYLEIVRPYRIVYTQQFCDDKNEKVTRHPMAPTWPATMLTVVTLAVEGGGEDEGEDEGRTRVTIEWETHGDVMPEELATFVAARGGMTQGWTGSFDKLEEYLLRV